MALDINHYLKAATRASDRGRRVVFAQLVASVLVFAAMLNSMQSDWLRQRLEALQDAHGDYVNSLIGAMRPDEHAAGQKDVRGASGQRKDEREHREKRYELLYESYVNAYVENTYFVRAPLFGFAFDINNLGLMGGLGFIVMLLVLRFSLIRELSNVGLSFREAREQGYPKGELRRFYELLSMEQVLTVPQDPDMKRYKILRRIPKMFFLVPTMVYFSVFAHDIVTAYIGDLMRANFHTMMVYSVETVCMIIIICLTFGTFRLHREIDAIWDAEWNRIKGAEGRMDARSR